MKYTYYTTEQLQPFVNEALTGNTKAAWLATIKKVLSTKLRTTPLFYRAFGPSWWAVKYYLQKDGLIGGDPVDSDLVKSLTLGDEFMDFIAAIAYNEYSIESLTNNDTVRQVTDEDGDPVDLSCLDEHMELG